MPIALDTSSASTLKSGVTTSWSHTCTGSNLALLIGFFGDTTDIVTGVTYGGISLTLIDKKQVPGDRFIYLYGLLNPATGSNSVVVTASGSIFMDGIAASYTGVKQSGLPDAETTASASSANSLTTSLTTATDLAWTVLFSKTSGGDPTAGTGATVRQHENGVGFFDSNGTITPAGPTSMQVTGSNVNFATVMAAIAPAITATPVKDTTRDWAEKQALQTKTGLTNVSSLYDLRRAFYGGKVSTTDAIRAYLKSQLSITTPQSLSDLWRLFFISKSVTYRVNLNDMAKDFFQNVGF